MFNFKKSIVAVMSALAISVTGIASTASAVSAVNLGGLNYWHSTDNNIGHMTVTPKIYVKNLSSNSSFNLNSYVGFGIYQWNSHAGTMCNLTGTESNHNIIVYGGPRKAIIAASEYFTEDNLKESYGGLTLMSYSSEGNYTYNGSTKYGQKMENSKIAILESSGASMSNSHYCKIAAHELGHALGYFGHSPNSGEIMSSVIDFNTKENLTSDEINHLKQVY